MTPDTNHRTAATGGCLCGAVRYEIHGELRGIVNCHCSKCLRFHGHIGAYTSAKANQVIFIEDRGLKWFQSPADETPNVHRGFCCKCGSSLFWHPKDQEKMAIAAGSLDDTTKLQTIGHIWTSQKSGYYEINDDLPRFEKGWAAMTGSKEE